MKILQRSSSSSLVFDRYPQHVSLELQLQQGIPVKQSKPILPNFDYLSTLQCDASSYALVQSWPKITITRNTPFYNSYQNWNTLYNHRKKPVTFHEEDLVWKKRIYLSDKSAKLDKNFSGKCPDDVSLIPWKKKKIAQLVRYRCRFLCNILSAWYYNDYWINS